jgi:DNA polymerase (family 10)
MQDQTCFAKGYEKSTSPKPNFYSINLPSSTGKNGAMKQAKLFGEEEPIVLTKLELAKAQTLARQVESIVMPLCDKLEVVGSIRRQKPMVGDVDFVAVGAECNWGKIVQDLKKAKVICAGKSVIKLNVPFENTFFQVDFYRATEQTFGILELIRTGSADHNMWLASYALSKGFRLKYSEGLIKDKVAVAGDTEESVFSALGLPTPKPEEREVIDGKPAWLKDQV